MQEQMSDTEWDIEWELRQLWMAVDHYERVIENTFFRNGWDVPVNVEKFSETIASLFWCYNDVVSQKSDPNYSPYSYIEDEDEPVSFDEQTLEEWEWG